MLRPPAAGYYRAASTKEFDEIFGEIDKLEKSDIKGPATHDYHDHYLRWLMIGDGSVLRRLWPADDDLEDGPVNYAAYPPMVGWFFVVAALALSAAWCAEGA